MLHVSDEVRAALADGRPVVALESTLVAHGLPWPENLEVGRAAEQAVRDEGALPATVAVLGGVLTVGVDAAALERIARGGFLKAGRGDVRAPPRTPAGAALPEPLVARAIEAALAAAARANLRGKALTPHLLAAVARETGARSLIANRALVLHNCRVAARIAAALAEAP